MIGAALTRLPRRILSVGIVLSLAAALAVPAAAQSPGPERASAEQIAAVLAASDGPDSAVHHVGVTSDPNVYIAVIDPGDGTASVYLCDGAELGVWLEGTLTDGVLDATGADGSTVSGAADGSSVSGTVTLADGSTLDFSADAADLPAGFYERSALLDGEAVIARTIQLPDGTAKGVKKPTNCAALEEQFYFKMEVANDTSLTDTVRAGAGNSAASTFRRAKLNGCQWATDLLTT